MLKFQSQDSPFGGRGGKLSDYTYDLPDERIAKFPLPKRDESKLQVYQQGKITHSVFKNITDYLPKNSLLVFNDTKVIPARIHFQKSTGAIIQIFLLHPVLPTSVINLAMDVTNSCVWECMIGNRKRWKKGDVLSQVLMVDGQEVEVKAEIFHEEKNYVQLQWKVVSRKSQVISENDNKLKSEQTLTTYDLRLTTNKPKEENLLTPFALDASQELALQQIKSGASMVPKKTWLSPTGLGRSRPPMHLPRIATTSAPPIADRFTKHFGNGSTST